MWLVSMGSGFDSAERRAEGGVYSFAGYAFCHYEDSNNYSKVSTGISLRRRVLNEEKRKSVCAVHWTMARKTEEKKRLLHVIVKCQKIPHPISL
jgi:hypothetical protein